MRSLHDVKEEFNKARAYGDVDRLRAQVVELAEFTTDEGRWTHAHACGSLATFEGDFENALSYLMQAVDGYLSAGDTPGVQYALSEVGQVYMMLNEPANALEVFHRAIDLRKQVDPDAEPAGILHNIGVVYYETGHFPQAIEYVQRALAASVKRNSAQFIANHHAALANMYEAWGDHETALRHCEEALQRHASLDDRVNVANDGMIKGAILESLDRREEARQIKQHALSALLDLEAYAFAAFGVTSAAKEAADAGNLEEAEETLAKYDHIIHRYRDAALLVPEIRAEILRQRGNLKEAASQLEAILEERLSHNQISNALEIAHRLRSIAQEANDLQAYIRYNEHHERLLDEVRGQEATRKLAILEKEREIEQERQQRERERAVLYSTLPNHVADRLIKGEEVTDHFDMASVLFMDIVGFTTISDRIPPGHVVHLLKAIFDVCDQVCKSHGVTRIKTIGDSYLAVCGVPEPFDDHAQRTATSAQEIMQRLNDLTLTMPPELGDTSWTQEVGEITVRIGLHCGPVVAGVVGDQHLQYDVWGDTVNTASRMESTGEPGRIQCSEAFAQLLLSVAVAERDETAISNSQQQLRERGAVEVKGKGTMTTYWLE